MDSTVQNSRRNTAQVVFGSAALWAWGFLAFLSPVLMGPTENSASQGLEIGFFYSQGTVVAAVAFLLVASRTRRLAVGRAVLLACALVLTFCTMAIPWALGEGSLPLIVLCGTICGVGDMLLSAAWGARYSLESRDVSAVVMVSFLLAYLLYLTVVYAFGRFGQAITVMLPLLSWVLWLKDASERHALSAEVFPTASGTHETTGKSVAAEGRPSRSGASSPMPGEMTAGIWEARVLPWHTIGVIVVAALIGNLVSSTIMGTSYEGADSLFPGGIVVCGCIALMALVPLTADHAAFSVSQLYRTTITFSAVGLVAIMVLGSSGLAVGGSLIQGTAMFFQPLVYVIVTRTTRTEGLPPLLSFGVGQALISVVVLVGNLAGKQLYLMLGPSQFVLTTICGASVLALFFMVVALAARKPLDANPAPDRASAPADMRLTEQQRPDEFSEGNAVVIEPLAATNARSDSDQERLKAFIDAFSLTTREAEILAYLVRGRSLPYIASELFVTTGTVKTHVRHIYGKVSVNSRQELLDAVESFEGAGM